MNLRKTDLARFKRDGLLSEITGIDILFLWRFEKASVAQRMSWASRRQTTRPEDMSYCLLGLFNVNMPLLNGEGSQRAFRRLQEIIISSSSDESIFAWTSQSVYLSGMLAQSPLDFAEPGEIVVSDWPTIWSKPNPWTLTNQGLRIELRCIDEDDSDGFETPLMCLNTRAKDQVTLRFQRLDGWNVVRKDSFRQCAYSTLQLWSTPVLNSARSPKEYLVQEGIWKTMSPFSVRDIPWKPSLKEALAQRMFVRLSGALKDFKAGNLESVGEHHVGVWLFPEGRELYHSWKKLHHLFVSWSAAAPLVPAVHVQVCTESLFKSNRFDPGTNLERLFEDPYEEEMRNAAAGEKKEACSLERGRSHISEVTSAQSTSTVRGHKVNVDLALFLAFDVFDQGQGWTSSTPDYLPILRIHLPETPEMPEAARRDAFPSSLERRLRAGRDLYGIRDPKWRLRTQRQPRSRRSTSEGVITRRQ